MLGFRHLKASNRLASLRVVKNALTKTQLELNTRHLSSIIFGTGKPHGEVIIRQYLLRLVATFNLNHNLLCSAGEQGSPGVYCMPKQWRTMIRQHGFKVAEFRSRLAWIIFVVLMFFRGVLNSLALFTKGLKQTKKSVVLGKYVYFDNLFPANLPQVNAQNKSYDIVTWYSQWPGRLKDIDSYCHNVSHAEPILLNNISVISIESPIPPLTKALLMPLMIWMVRAFLCAFTDLFLGRWWHALLLNEALKAKMVRLHAGKGLAKEYLFYEMHYRPLWTYEAEKFGSKITFYFYALWEENFRCFDQFKHVSLEHGLEAMNWPHYLVWDKYQADLVYRAAGQLAHVSIVGPIWFSMKPQKTLTLPQRTIAVFDCATYRESFSRMFPVESAYCTAKVVNQFLSDIDSVIKDCGAFFALKRKREIGNRAHRGYISHIEMLSKGNHFINVETDFSPCQLIEHCIAVISIPFTSTAVIAKELGKPSIYYDPTGLMKLDSEQAHGVLIINTVTKLREWVYLHIMKHQRFLTNSTCNSNE